jgi:hypothetical protein
MTRTCSIVLLAAFYVCAQRSAVADTIDFEEHSLPVGGYWNGADGSGGFSDHGASFNNNFTDYGYGWVSWSGWAYSRVEDSTTPGFGNQYASFAGKGADGSNNYGIAYLDAYNGVTPYVNLPSGHTPISVCVTNTTYAGISMREGDSIGKKFGWGKKALDGSYPYNGEFPDWFSVTLTGYSGMNTTGSQTGSTTFMLADYTFEDNGLDYVVNDWRQVNLTPLHNAVSIGISFASSDSGEFGINTPTYAAFDNFVLAPEPSTLVLLAAGALAALVWRLRKR